MAHEPFHAPADADHAPARGRQTSLTLLQRIRGNQADAWRTVVHLYTPLVHHWCGRFGVRGADADDVAQEVFRAAATGLSGFRRDQPGDTFRGWLRGITRNMVRVHFRRASKQPHASGGTDAFEQLQEVADPADASDDGADAAGEINSLYRRALELVRGEFEERTWHAFWLTVVENRTPAEIAASLGVTAAAIRKAKSRVLRRLKEEVGELID